MKRFWHRFVTTVAVVLLTAVAALSPAGPAVADSTKLPVQAAFTLSLPNGGPTPSQFQIPEGKRLVIEQVTIHAGVPTGTIMRMRLGTQVFGQSVLHVIGLPPSQVLDAVFDVVNAAIPVKLYADPGTTVHLLLDNLRPLPPGFGVSVEGTLSGFLVDCGPGPGCPLP